MLRTPKALVALIAGLAALAVLAVATVTDAATSGVTLRLGAGTPRAGHQVEARLVNDSDATLELAMCPTLSRLMNGHWVAITHTHGASVACPRQDPVGSSVKPHADRAVDVELYDDLVPGTYRVTLPYRDLGKSTVEPPFSAASTPVASVSFHVLSFDPGPEPHLSTSRINTIARAAAKRDGDATPSLVQSAESSRFLADLVASRGGDLGYAWNWSYLIAIRGSFLSPPIPTPVGVPTGPGPVRVRFSVLALIVNARTGDITDVDTTRSYPDLARLGPVSTERG